MTRPTGLITVGGLVAVLGACTTRTLEPAPGDDIAEDAGPSQGTTVAGGSGSTTAGPNASNGFGASSGGSPAPSCNGLVIAYVRDFRESHPDMERFGQTNHEAYGNEVEHGIVKDLLGADRKPVFNMATNTTTTAENFWQWYNDVEGVNVGFEVPLQFEEIEPGKWRFASEAFFPADGKGFKDWSGTDDKGIPHNYHFTLELHTLFRYTDNPEKQQTFKFRGDDDVFTFINNKLVVDLGGVHETAEKEIDLKTKLPDLVPGQTYPLDFFFAERHVTNSTFMLETSLALERCDIIIR